MKNHRSSLALLAVIALMTLAACTRAPKASKEEVAAWRTDLEYLAERLPRAHPNPFHTVTKDAFDKAAEKVAYDLPLLTSDQVTTRVMAVVALVGDGHTHLDLPSAWPRYPIEFAWFDNQLRVVASPTDSATALNGKRVVAMGMLTIDSVMSLVSDLVPRGENAGRTRFTATQLLASPVVLHGIGASDNATSVTITLQDDSGVRSQHTIAARDPRDMPPFRIVAAKPMLWLQHLDRPWWLQTMPNGDAVYLSFSAYPPDAEFAAMADSVRATLTRAGASKLVIDLRRNAGGDFKRFRNHMLPVLQAWSQPDARTIYVITGPATFSAAMVNTIDLRKLGAVVVGEPTGARPNSYSEHGEFRLPSTRLRVSFSTRYYRFGEDGDSAVVPDQVIRPTFAQFAAGRDSVMEWIIAR